MIANFDLDAKVPEKFFESGVWLRDAWRHFSCPTSAQSDAIAAEQKFAELNDGLIPDVFMAIKSGQPETFRQMEGEIEGDDSKLAWRLYWSRRNTANMSLKVALLDAGRFRACGFPDERTLTAAWISPRLWFDANVNWDNNYISSGKFSYWCVKVIKCSDAMKAATPADSETSEAQEPEITPKLVSGLGPWDEDEAQVFLSAEKVSGRHKDRPNERALVQLLTQKFDSVPRDPMRGVARKVWPHARPGVRKGTTRPSKPRN